MIILRQKIYTEQLLSSTYYNVNLKPKKFSKLELNKLGRETDAEIREAVKGTKAESKVSKILDKSTKEMKKAAQKEYAAVDKKGNVVKTSINALKEARDLGYTRKQAVQAAKRILKRAEDSANDDHDKTKKMVDDIVDQIVGRTRIGFRKDRIQSLFPGDHKFAIGFKPDQTEPTRQKVKLGFKKFSKQDREIVPADIVKKVKDGGGVIQKDHNGDWRIISMKTKTNKSGMPEFWPSRFKTKESALDQLQAYQKSKHG